MGDGNSVAQSGNGTIVSQSVWWPVQWITSATNALSQMCQHITSYVQSSPLTKHAVEVVGDWAVPMGAIVMDASLGNVVKVITKKEAKIHLSDIELTTTQILESIVKYASNYSPKLMLDVTLSCVDTVLCFLTKTDSLGGLIKGHKTTTSICTTAVTTTINTAIGLATGTLPLIVTDISISCVKSLCKSAMKGIGVASGKQIVINSMLNYAFSGKLKKTLVKLIANMTKEYCKMLLNPAASIVNNSTGKSSPSKP